MGVLAYLASHWVLALVLLLTAAGAALWASIRILTESRIDKSPSEADDRLTSTHAGEADALPRQEEVRAFSASASVSSAADASLTIAPVVRSHRPAEAEPLAAPRTPLAKIAEPSEPRVEPSAATAPRTAEPAGDDWTADDVVTEARTAPAPSATEATVRDTPAPSADDSSDGASRTDSRIAAGIVAHELRQAFRSAFQYLSGRTEGRAEQKNDIPLYLLIGTPQAGKSTLLDQMHLPWPWKQNQRTFGVSSGMLWKFSEQGILLKLPGSYLLDAAEGRAAWRHIPLLLQKHRPRRPLDGLVLVLPANLLTVSTPEAIARREQALDQIRQALEELSQTISMRLPVYVIISKCDLLPGFTRLCQELPAHNRQDVLGWSNPNPPEQEFEPALVDDAFREIHKTFLCLEAEVSVEKEDDPPLLLYFELSNSLQRLFDSLRLSLSGLLASHQTPPPRILRGIYFCGDMGAPTPHSEEPPSSRSLFQAAKRRFAARANRQILFLDQLAQQRIFPEWGIAAPHGPLIVSRHPWARAMQAAALALSLGFGAGATYAGIKLAALRDRRILPMLQQLQHADPSVPATRLLQAMANGGESPLRSWLLPASLFSGVDAEMQRQMKQTLETRVYPGLFHDLQKQGRQLAEKWVGIAANPPKTNSSQGASSPDQLAEFRSLQEFSHDWEQLQDEIESYQSMAHSEHQPAPIDVERSLRGLGAPAAQPLDASSPLYRAIAAAHGKAYAYPRADQQTASQVMRDLVRRLFYRWYLGNDLIIDLQALARTPVGPEDNLQRTRLSAKVRTELADPRLSSILQDDHRLIAPIYSITLGAVHRSGYLDPDLREFIQNEATGDVQQVQSIVEQLRSPLGSALISLQNGHWQLAPELQ